MDRLLFSFVKRSNVTLYELPILSRLDHSCISILRNDVILDCIRICNYYVASAGDHFLRRVGHCLLVSLASGVVHHLHARRHFDECPLRGLRHGAVEPVEWALRRRRGRVEQIARVLLGLGSETKDGARAVRPLDDAALATTLSQHKQGLLALVAGGSPTTGRHDYCLYGGLLEIGTQNGVSSSRKMAKIKDRWASASIG